jgi:starvation-inducible DNA-binding protein
MNPSRLTPQKLSQAEDQLEVPNEEFAEVCSELKRLLADVFAIYVKTKNFHWHMSGPHFRDYHLLLDEHGDQLFAMTDPIAERCRKLGGDALRSIGDIARQLRVRDNDDKEIAPEAMLEELLGDNSLLAGSLRAAHTACDDAGDVATASLIENWLDETERRIWFLKQIRS